MATLWEGDYPVKMVLKSENDSDLANEYIPVMGGTSAFHSASWLRFRPTGTTAASYAGNGVRTISIIGEP